MQRRRGLLLGLTAIGLLAVAGLGVRELVQRYPNQGFLSAERLNDALLILLGTDIRLGRYQPEPVLKVPLEHVERASYAATDVHWHLNSQRPELTVERLVAAMDAAGIQRIVNLGGLPQEFKKAAAYTEKYPDRFVLFVKPDLAAAVSDERGLEAGVAEQVKWMQEAARLGARGVKISKSLGMGQRTRDGQLLAVDDPRLDPIWETAGKLGWPVLIHTGDAEAFFRKPDGHNERYEEMLLNPQWVRYGKEPSLEELFAQRERLLARHPRTIFIGAHFGMQEDDLAQVAALEKLFTQRERLLARHPGTIFIGAHFGMQEDDLAQVAALLDRFPNYYVDTAAIAHALGRQPVTARAFFLRYQDRILFGTDGGFGLVPDGPGWTPQRLFRSYIEFFETSNEYVEYPLWGAYNQGRWRIYGLDLPGEVLEKIYASNAARLIPSREDVTQRLTGS